MNFKKFSLLLLTTIVIVLLAFNMWNFPVQSQSAGTPSPTLKATATPRPAPKNKTNDLETTLLFTGDINPGRCIALKAMLARDFTYPFHYVAERLRSADITVGSLDGTLSDQSGPMACPYSMNLIGPSSMVDGMQVSGFDVMTLATNHSSDCGEKSWVCSAALEDTIRNLSAAGISPVGAGSTLTEARAPLIITRNNIRFAFLGINQIERHSWAEENRPGSAPLAPEYIDSIKQDIASARAQADVVIVLAQWGAEYTTRPEHIQREWAKEFIDAGATLVIGNQPHLTQPMEIFPNGIVFYSLGNFVFDQPKRSQRESVVVQVTFKGSQLENWTLIPAYINYYTMQTHWADSTDAESILRRVTILK